MSYWRQFCFTALIQHPVPLLLLFDLQMYTDQGLRCSKNIFPGQFIGKKKKQNKTFKPVAKVYV